MSEFRTNHGGGISALRMDLIIIDNMFQRHPKTALGSSSETTGSMVTELYAALRTRTVGLSASQELCRV